MAFYHLYTDGRYQSIIFKEESDFVFGMNAVAMSMLHCKVRIFAFTLMDNHVHFVVDGDSSEAGKFIRNYKWRLSNHFNWKFVEKGSGMKEIFGSYHLKIAIAYCLRNPFVAGMVPHPCRYQWSSAGGCFALPGNDRSRDVLKRVGELGVRERRKLFLTRQEIPEDYLFDGKGMILPSCYVAIAEVERLFSNKGNYYHYLFHRVEGMMDGEASGNVRMASLSDNVLVEGVLELLSAHGRRKKFCELSPDERDGLIKELRYRYNPSDKQLARVMGSLASWQ